MAKDMTRTELNIRAVIISALREVRLGRREQAAFFLGQVWNHITPAMDADTHAIADDLRRQLGVTKNY